MNNIETHPNNNDIKISALISKDWKSYQQSLSKLSEEQSRLSYNIVSISTYSGHIENYHSDIWGFLLDPNGQHRKGNHFLVYFCYYLVGIGCLDESISKQFYFGNVKREKGRIDICIINEDRTACIIIENKINNAVDQQDQLERYYDYAQRNGLKVEATLYVSARGERLMRIDEHTVTAIAASNYTKDDLLNGWLLPAKKSITYNGSAVHDDILSFIHQYSLLLQHQSFLSLKIIMSKTLYELLNSSDDLEAALLIKAELDKVKVYRYQVFSEKMVGDYFKPFKKKKAFSDTYLNHMIFQDWNFQKKFNFQLDIDHHTNYTRFIFYETKGRLSVDETERFLVSVLGNHQFKPNNKVDHTHQFEFSVHMRDGFRSLEQLDASVVDKAKELFSAMDIFNSQER